MKQIPDPSGENGGGKAICVQDVSAPKSAVWNQILDFDHYLGKVSKLKDCKNYLVKRKDDGTIQIKTKMIVSALPGYNVSFFIHMFMHAMQFLVRFLYYDISSLFTCSTNTTVIIHIIHEKTQ